MSQVVELTSQRIQRKRLDEQGSHVFVEFYRAPGVDFADFRIDSIPDDCALSELAMWLRSAAYELDQIDETVESEQTGQE